MFVEAIESAAAFTRPIHSISRNYGSTIAQAGASTLFFVNDDGWALTCRHVANLLIGAEQLLKRRNAFRAELAQRAGEKKHGRLLRELETKYGYKGTATYELLNMFVGCVEDNLDCEVKLHQHLDVALLHFRNAKLQCTSFPTFAKDGASLKPGKMLCRLGFPFPEFTNFEYDKESDQIRWTSTGRAQTPRFPLEGMVTRHLIGENGTIVGFEMSTPGLRGQSGGPAFDREGRVWGMQSATNHLDLDFDVDKEVLRGGRKKRVQDSAFLHVGHCVHVDALKVFMKEHNVAFVDG